MQLRKLCLPVAGALLLSLAGCGGDEERNDVDDQLTQVLQTAAGTEGLDYFTMPESDDYSSIPQDANNPVTAEKVALGKMLFHETAIGTNPKVASGVGTYSCASCHHSRAGFQAGVGQGIGEGGSGFGLTGENRIANAAYLADQLDIQPIRSPSAMNAAYQELMLWNGQFGANGANVGTEAQWDPTTPVITNELGYDGLETQAIAGLGVHRMDFEGSVVQDNAEYIAMFDAAFPSVPVQDRYSRENAGLAIAAYERTLLSNEAPFQQWLKGDRAAMSEIEKKGAILFFGKAGCNNCHTGPALSSMEFYALGMDDLDASGQPYAGAIPDGARLGRGGFTGVAADNYKFKVPQLYNLKDSPFYGHGASFTSIEEVVRYKNAGIAQNTEVPADQLAADFSPISLTEEEIGQLTAFLESSLHDPDLARYNPASLPSGYCFPNNDAQSRTDLGCN